MLISLPADDVETDYYYLLDTFKKESSFWSSADQPGV